MSDKPELKPCPFCGEIDGVECFDLPNDYYKIECCSEMYCGRNKLSDETVDDMTKRYWNTRPIEDALRQRIAELEAQLAEAQDERNATVKMCEDKLAEARRDNLRQRVEDILSGENCSDNMFIALCCEHIFDCKDRMDKQRFTDWLIEQEVDA